MTDHPRQDQMQALVAEAEHMAAGYEHGYGVESPPAVMIRRLVAALLSPPAAQPQCPDCGAEGEGTGDYREGDREERELWRCVECGFLWVPPAAPRQDWQPIATAPKDGTDVLTFGLAGRVVARWEDDAWRIYNYGYEDATVRKSPTHWQPLPSPPVVPQEQEP